MLINLITLNTGYYIKRFWWLKMPKHKLANSEGSPAKKSTTSAHWANGLLTSMNDPDLLVKSDDMVSIIRDKYPKAEFHYLVICKKNIPSIKHITYDDLSLLEHMDKIGRELTKKDLHNNKEFYIGYHSEPSMVRLHLHVISDDFHSECMKTKKQWNSFVTPFLLKSEDVIKSLTDTKIVNVSSRQECKQYLDTPLQCHKCSFKPKNMPDLKKHLITHLQEKSNNC